MKFRLLEKINTKRIIINPQDNPELANKLQPIIDTFETDIICRRDNCGPIMYELFLHLRENGVDVDEDRDIKHGEFRTDNLNLLDRLDLTKEDRAKTKQQYGNLTNASIQQYVFKNLDFEDYHKLPHYWIEYKGLIIDPTSKMFLKGMEGPITKKNYII